MVSETGKKEDIMLFIIVLILVVLEDGLGVKKYGTYNENDGCLNPCCSGGWSRSWANIAVDAIRAVS